MSSKRKRKRDTIKRQATPVSLAPSPWDMGAAGKANQERLTTEPATDFDPETGRETPNPNGVRRRRRESWVRIYGHRNLSEAQVAAAEKLRMAAEGMRERDPLAAIGEVRTAGGDPQVAYVDARRYFRQLWAAIPLASRPVVERVVLDDLPIWSGCGRAAWGRHMQRLSDGLCAIA